jgi:hypothetical protein
MCLAPRAYVNPKNPADLVGEVYPVNVVVNHGKPNGHMAYGIYQCHMVNHGKPW